MAPSTYLSLLLIISLTFISHAISPSLTPSPIPSPTQSPTPISSPTPTRKLYENICHEIVLKFPYYEQTCLKLLEAYPEITSAKDYITFTKSYCKIVAIENATKTQVQVKELVNKYPSSPAVKACATTDYNAVVNKLKVVPVGNPTEMNLALKNAMDSLNICKQRLDSEKIVDTSLSTVNSAMAFVIEIGELALEFIF